MGHSLAIRPNSIALHASNPVQGPTPRGRHPGSLSHSDRNVRGHTRRRLPYDSNSRDASFSSDKERGATSRLGSVVQDDSTGALAAASSAHRSSSSYEARRWRRLPWTATRSADGRTSASRHVQRDRLDRPLLAGRRAATAYPCSPNCSSVVAPSPGPQGAPPAISRTADTVSSAPVKVAVEVGRPREPQRQSATFDIFIGVHDACPHRSPPCGVVSHETQATFRRARSRSRSRPRVTIPRCR